MVITVSENGAKFYVLNYPLVTLSNKRSIALLRNKINRDSLFLTIDLDFRFA